VVGVRLDGGVELADLAEPNTAHVLVAGMTGSGKTEWLRTAIASLLVCNTPETLRLVLIDPKQTAFQELKRSPFLWDEHAFWLPGSELAITELLMRLVAEMDGRYQLLGKSALEPAELLVRIGDRLVFATMISSYYF
jgi:S-DNA-T family DNA segregation ATPase FtsK/SpoIIIE